MLFSGVKLLNSEVYTRSLCEISNLLWRSGITYEHLQIIGQTTAANGSRRRRVWCGGQSNSRCFAVGSSAFPGIKQFAWGMTKWVGVVGSMLLQNTQSRQLPPSWSSTYQSWPRHIGANVRLFVSTRPQLCEGGKGELRGGGWHAEHWTNFAVGIYLLDGICCMAQLFRNRTLREAVHPI